MQHIWTNHQSQPVKIKKFLQSQGFGHRLISDIKHGQGQLLVNRQRVQPTDTLAAEQSITVIVKPEIPDETVVASQLPIQVVFENDNWLVVDKPAGITSIPGPSNQEDTLLNRIKGYLIKQQDEDLRPHLITRLDRFTSGLMLVAKNRVAQSLIAQQVQSHQIDKRYLAIATGRVSPDHQLIDLPIGRVDNSPRRAVMQIGQSARTEYWCEQTNEQWSLLRLKLHTGRTHQIRVHLSNAGHPLLGDQLYGGETQLINRQALHATQLSFIDPFTGEKLTFTSPMPADMCAVLEKS